MSSEFEMSMVGELSFFLGLQIKQSEDGIFISQTKYARNLVKRFGLESAKHMKTPIGKNDKLSRDDVGTSVDPSLQEHDRKSFVPYFQQTKHMLQC